MAKRAAESSNADDERLQDGERPLKPTDAKSGEMGEFADDWEDEFESEDEIIEAGVDGRPDEEREAEERENAMEVDQETFIPGRHTLAAGETLAPDTTVYEMLHGLDPPTGGSCYSFDIVKDQLGSDRKSYPATIYVVAGTQAARGREKDNQLVVMKVSGLSKMEQEGEESESEDEDEDAEAILETKAIPMSSSTNRIRAHQSPQVTSGEPPTTITAAMTESGQVLIHDITPHISAFDTPGTTLTPQQSKPVCTIRAHKSVEGYALDWSPLVAEGKLLTGDESGKIFSTTRTSGGGFVTDTTPYLGHEGAVYELQWSPNERSVFASSGNDGTVKVWDIRSKSRKPVISMKVSNTDVNVLSWSHLNNHLLASGADDGEWGVWDLRQWKPPGNTKPTPAASFNFHKKNISCIEWHPTDDSVALVVSGDSTVTLWDLSVELDDEESKDTGGVKDIPSQCLFVHYMEDVAEAHWHPQIPGCVMATGIGGFGIFKTISF